MRQDKEFTLPAGAEVSIIPVMQGEGLLKIDESELPEILPVLALRNAVLFPGAVFPITIGREKSVRLIQDAEKEGFFIGAVPQNDVMVEEPQEEDLSRYGSVCKVLKTLEMPDGTITAILQAFKRLQLDAVLGYEPYITARVHYLPDILQEDPHSTDIKAITGGGGMQEYFRMIADPEYKDLGPASALYSPSMVTDAIKTAIVLLEGGEAEPVVVIPTTIVSAENVDEWLDPENTVY